MPNPYETAAQILASLAKSDSVKPKEIPQITTTHLKSIVYSNSRSGKKPSGQSKKESQNNNDLRQIYAIVVSTLRYAPVLKSIISNSQLFTVASKSKTKPGAATQERRYFINEWHIYAMVHDLLLSKSKRITAPKCKTKEAILNNKTRLNGEFVKWKVRNRVHNDTDMQKFTFLIKDDDDSGKGNGENEDTPVRWIRLNGIKITTPEEFQIREKELTKDGQIGFVSDWKNVKDGIYKDTIIQNLYGVNPSSIKFPITSTKLYATGRLIIQDRASCLPATILVENLKQLGIQLKTDLVTAKSKIGDTETKDHIQLIDSCSAPGNKTTHLTSLTLTSYPYMRQKIDDSITNSNKRPNSSSLNKFVAAFEKSPFRGKTLLKMLQVAGAAKYVDVNVQDFTKTNVLEYPNVVGLVVDPSCSGSGIFGRVKNDEVDQVEEVDEDDNADADIDVDIGNSENDGLSEKERQRLLKLAGFQYKIVKHALSFPKSQVVVYSTCSIHAIENEHVVSRLLSDPDLQAMGWRVQSREHVVPNWPRRGFPDDVKVKGMESDEMQRIAEGCVRALPKEDGGIGFFAVCFVKDI